MNANKPFNKKIKPFNFMLIVSEKMYQRKMVSYHVCLMIKILLEFNINLLLTINEDF